MRRGRKKQEEKDALEGGGCTPLTNKKTKANQRSMEWAPEKKRRAPGQHKVTEETNNTRTTSPPKNKQCRSGHTLDLIVGPHGR